MRSRSIGFPVVLIILGVVMLAQNVFPEWSWLFDQHRFWPVLLIVWGVLMLGRRAGWRQL